MMANNYYFPQGYQPAYYPQVQQMAQPQMQQPQQQQQAMTDIKWVQGEAGAKSYMVAPNTSVTLWDSESQVIYIKSANASGLPTMTVIDYTIRSDASHNRHDLSQSDFATKEDVSLLRDEIESLRAKFADAEGKAKK